MLKNSKKMIFRFFFRNTNFYENFFSFLYSRDINELTEKISLKINAISGIDLKNN
jgi:hypothetical protein